MTDLSVPLPAAFSSVGGGDGSGVLSSSPDFPYHGVIKGIEHQFSVYKQEPTTVFVLYLSTYLDKSIFLAAISTVQLLASTIRGGGGGGGVSIIEKHCL